MTLYIFIPMLIILFLMSWFDLKSRIIPHTLTIMLLILGIINGCIDENFKLFNWVLFGVFSVIFIFTFYIFDKIGKPIGGGDIKLMFLFGITLGYDMVIVSIFLGAFLAFPISLYILLKRKDNMIPFGPFLSIGALLILITKLDLVKILNWLQDTIIK